MGLRPLQWTHFKYLLQFHLGSLKEGVGIYNYQIPITIFKKVLFDTFIPITRFLGNFY